MRNKILQILRESRDNYISGEEMADKLGVSRTAVWKHIKEMRAQGYDIESHARKGYVLKETPDALLSGEIAHDLQTSVIGQNIICHEEIDSTNNEAKRLAREGAAEGTVVVAECQTGGKGRLERQFFSLPQEAPKCTLMAAVAVARAMAEFGLEPGIKWPNDLLYENKKLVGILTEMSAEMDGINYIVIGTGINVNIDQSEFPEDIRDVATSLCMMKGEPLPRVKFFQAVLRAMDDLYAQVQAQGFAPVLQEWRKYSITLGQEVKVIGVRDGEVYFGKAVDIDEDGALLVDTEEGRKKVLAGDVSIRPRSGKW